MDFKPTSYTIAPKVVRVKTPTGSVAVISEELEEYFKSISEIVRSTVVDKMRRGVSPAAISEQASVGVAIEGGDKPSLRVYSYSVRAAIDEKGREPGGVPPFGPASALRAWAEFFLDTTSYPRVRGLALAIYRRGQPSPTDPLGLNRPFARTRDELSPMLRDGLVRVRADAIDRLNHAGPYKRPRRSPFTGPGRKT
jgi:hypothetical protein